MLPPQAFKIPSLHLLSCMLHHHIMQTEKKREGNTPLLWQSLVVLVFLAHGPPPYGQSVSNAIGWTRLTVHEPGSGPWKKNYSWSSPCPSLICISCVYSHTHKKTPSGSVSSRCEELDDYCKNKNKSNIYIIRGNGYFHLFLYSIIGLDSSFSLSLIIVYIIFMLFKLFRYNFRQLESDGKVGYKCFNKYFF